LPIYNDTSKLSINIMTEDSKLLLAFYLTTGTDHMGRSLDEILEKNDLWLERTHDYIQWLFPLYVQSQFNPQAPLLTNEVREIFLDDTHPDYVSLHANFSSAIQRMLSFYGYASSPKTNNNVAPSSNWQQRSNNWQSLDNHNHLRITRMLRCMTLLGRHSLAVSFLEQLIAAVKQHPTIISPRTLDFWNEAVILPQNC